MSRFRKNVLNHSKFRLFLISKLPMAWLAGLRVKKLTDEKCAVSVKLKYLTKNPFKSMYWAVQGMAAELSTGLLVSERVQKALPEKVSMLVFESKAEFSKKAKGRILFTCKAGKELDEIFEKVLNTDEGYIIPLTSIGTDESGDVVSKFVFTWTLKRK